MKRFLFFLIILAAVAGSAYVILFKAEIAGLMNNKDYLKNYWELIKSNNFKFGSDTGDIYLYALVLSLAINAIILFTLVIMLLLHFGIFTRVSRFYSVAGWFFFSALVFTAGYLYAVTNKYNSFDFDVLKDQPLFFVPLGASIVAGIIAMMFRGIERRSE